MAGVPRTKRYNLVRIDAEGPYIALLNYPGFFDEPFPALRESWLVDLDRQTVTLPDGQQAGFPIDPYRKTCLLQGLDDLGYLLSKDAVIAAFEASRTRDT